MTRHKDEAILYWFEPPESKTLRPVLRFVLLRSQVEVVCGLHVLACPREDALARLILGDGQGRWTGVQVGYNSET
jgi:hypothetical protein